VPAAVKPERDAMLLLMQASRGEGPACAVKPVSEYALQGQFDANNKRRRGYQCVGCQEEQASRSSWRSPLCNCSNRAWCANDRKNAARCDASGCALDALEEPGSNFIQDPDGWLICLICKRTI
jgi:hypothetical protein